MDLIDAKDSELEDYEKAKKAALSYIAARALFTKELCDKLHKKGFSLAAIEKAIAYCRALGALCDEELLEKRIRGELHKGRGALRVRQKFQSVGIDVPMPSEEEEKEALLAYLEKKRITLPLSREQGYTLLASLQRRGFSMALLRAVLFSS